MSAITRNNVQIMGRGGRAMVFAHGYGCDQTMWRFVAPAFHDAYSVVLFDHVGAGKSDLSAYDREKYGTLGGYAADVMEICDELQLQDFIFVGHSVSSTIGMLAAIKAPERFRSIIHIGPSACYVNDGSYVGGFNREDIEQLLDFLDSNHLGWSAAMAPAIMGNPDRPELSEELTNSFCRTDPEIAKHFARVTFTSDVRELLPRVQTRSLLLQCSDDVIAPICVGEYLHAHLPESELVIMRATGHCPHLSAPDETIAAMRAFLDD